MPNDFVAALREDELAYRDYVFAELRLARRRAQLMVLEIETIGMALRGDIVDPDLAMEWLRDANALDFLLPTEPAWQRPDDSATAPAAGEQP